MIEFDDAGIGCTLLGEVYVARRVETDEIVTEFIHVRERGTRMVIDVLYSMLKKLQPKEGEIISLCRGKVFNGFDQFLKKKDFVVTRDKIVGKTNDLAEKVFIKELYKIGLPKSISLKGKNYGTFYQSVLLWYQTFYEGENIIKNPNKKRKPKERDYMMNQVCHYPHLLSILFDIPLNETLKNVI